MDESAPVVQFQHRVDNAVQSSALNRSGGGWSVQTPGEVRYRRTYVKKRGEG